MTSYSYNKYSNNPIGTKRNLSSQSMGYTASGSSANSRPLESSLMSNKFAPASNNHTRTFKHTELPWTSMLPSSRRYPLSKSSTTFYSSNLFTPPSQQSNMTNASSSYRPSNDNDTSWSYKKNTTASYLGRSIFDTPSYRAPVSFQPTGRVYDGQLRRAVTTRERNYQRPEPAYLPQERLVNANSSSTRYPKTDDKTSAQRPLTNNSVKNSTFTDSTTTKSQLSTQHQDTNRSTVGKPFRTTSLKLRNSYNNILDQLASTTLTMLKLSSSSKQVNKPILEESPDDNDEQLSIKTEILRKKSDTILTAKEKPVQEDSFRVSSPGGSILSGESSASHIGTKCSPTISSTSSNVITVSPVVGYNCIKEQDSLTVDSGGTPKGSSSSGCGTSEQGDDEESRIQQTKSTLESNFDLTSFTLHIDDDDDDDDNSDDNLKMDGNFQEVSNKPLRLTLLNFRMLFSKSEMCVSALVRHIGAMALPLLALPLFCSLIASAQHSSRRKR